MDSSDAQEDHQNYRKRIKFQDICTPLASTPSCSNILFSDGKTKLLDFISSMETPKTLEKYLKSIININVSLPSDSPLWPGSTPLHLAVMYTDEHLKNNKRAAMQLINQLLDKGAKINVQNCRGATPLHLSFRLEQEQLVSLLLRKLERLSENVVNLLDDENLSYLHIFCSISDLRNNLARKLLNEKDVESSVNVVYKGEDLASLKKGWTPLHMAVDGFQLPLVELLLKRGADVLHADNRGYTVIHHLFGTTGREKIIDALFPSKPLEEWPDMGLGLTKLHLAVWFNDARYVKRLIDSGANIDAVLGTLKVEHWGHWERFNGCTPLHVAIIMCQVEIMEILLQRGANINAQRYDGKTALHLALGFMEKTTKYYSSVYTIGRAVGTIIAAYADVNILDWNGESALTYAIKLLTSDQFSYDRDYIKKIIALVLLKIQEMKLCGIEPSKLDETLVTTAFQVHGVRLHFPYENALCDQLQATEKIKIGKRGLSLRSFLRETHAISMYPSLMPADRIELDKFFQSFDYQKFPYLSALLKIQYRKAVERLSMIDAASDALRTFIGFDFPHVCVDIILKYLSNMQLKTLIRATLIGDTEENVA